MSFKINFKICFLFDLYISAMQSHAFVLNQGYLIVEKKKYIYIYFLLLMHSEEPQCWEHRSLWLNQASANESSLHFS